jgi:hypothetical protein
MQPKSPADDLADRLGISPHAKEIGRVLRCSLNWEHFARKLLRRANPVFQALKI